MGGQSRPATTQSSLQPTPSSNQPTQMRPSASIFTCSTPSPSLNLESNAPLEFSTRALSSTPRAPTTSQRPSGKRSTTGKGVSSGSVSWRTGGETPSNIHKLASAVLAFAAQALNNAAEALSPLIAGWPPISSETLIAASAPDASADQHSGTCLPGSWGSGVTASGGRMAPVMPKALQHRGRLQPPWSAQRPEPALQQHRFLQPGGRAVGGFVVDAPAGFLEGLVQAGEVVGRLRRQPAAPQGLGQHRRTEQGGGVGQGGEAEVVLFQRQRPRPVERRLRLGPVQHAGGADQLQAQLLLRPGQQRGPADLLLGDQARRVFGEVADQVRAGVAHDFLGDVLA